MKDDEYYGYEGKWQRREEVQCPDCEQMFYPTPDNEKYCSRCNAIFEVEMERQREFEESEDYDAEYLCKQR